MSDVQRGLVQCPKCGNWYIVRIMVGKRGFVTLNALADAETGLAMECRDTHHKGRRKASTKE